MTFDWREYFAVADELSRQASEGHFRASISRAYYAAYWTARLKLGPGWRYQTHPHADVIERFRYSRIQEAREIGDDLEGLMRRRVEADYEAKPTIAQWVARWAVAEARDIIQRVDKLRSI